jgi:ketosteroid isomerase-like protein
MTDRDEFLTWVRTALYEAELALHNGDAAPRRALWSRNEPVSVLGAARSAYGQQEIDELFTALSSSFSDCTSYTFDLQACDVAGDMAYTVGLEHTSASVDGQPRTYTAGHPGIPPRIRRMEGRPPPWRPGNPMTVSNPAMVARSAA